MKQFLKKTTVLLLIFFFIPVVLSSQNLYTKQQWIEDLDFLVTKLKELHPHLYYRVTEEKFNTVVENAIEEINNSKTDLECFFALKRVMASIQDIHTQLFACEKLGLEDLRFPFRLEKFTDGVYYITGLFKNN